jgi:hypothetical protein
LFKMDFGRNQRLDTDVDKQGSDDGQRRNAHNGCLRRGGRPRKNKPTHRKVPEIYFSASDARRRLKIPNVRPLELSLPCLSADIIHERTDRFRVTEPIGLNHRHSIRTPLIPIADREL